MSIKDQLDGKADVNELLKSERFNSMEDRGEYSKGGYIEVEDSYLIIDTKNRIIIGEEYEDPASSNYADFETDEGDLVLYSSDNHQAWIQSSVSIPVDEKR